MTLAALAWWGLCLAVFFGSIGLALLQPRLARQGEQASRGDGVSLLIPVRGAPAGLAPASLSVFTQDLPDMETIFTVARDDEEGAAAVRAVLAAAPAGQAPRFVRSAPLPGANPKIANLLPAYAAAAHDRLIIKDALTVLPPGQVEAMLRRLTPGIGLVCAAPIGRDPQGLAAEVEAALINTYGARMLLAAAALGLGVGIGAVMALSRSDLDRAGGLAVLAPAIADDHALCKALAGLGLRTAFTAQTVDQPLGRREAGAVWRRHLRWALCRRTSEPLAFWLEPLFGLPAAVLAAFLAFDTAPAVAATLLAWIAGELVLAFAKGWPHGPLSVPAILLREALLPFLWLAALSTRRIVWGDRAVAVKAELRP